MAETCPSCGRLLDEEEICRCSFNEASEPQEEDTPVNQLPQVEQNDVNSLHNDECLVKNTEIKPMYEFYEADNNISCCKSSPCRDFFKKPYSSTILSSKQNLWISILYILLQAVVIGIFVVVMIGQLIAHASGWLPAIDRILGLGGWFRYWGHSIEPPYLEIFLKAFFFVIIQFLMLTGLFFISGKLFGEKEGSFQPLVNVMSTASILSAIFFAAATLLMPLFPSTIGIAFLASFVITLLLNHAGVREVFLINENKGIYSTTLVYLVYYLLLNLFVANI